MKKLAQVEIIIENCSKELERKTNKFLIERKLDHSNIIDVKYQRKADYKSTMIIYEIEMEQTDQ